MKVPSTSPFGQKKKPVKRLFWLGVGNSVSWVPGTVEPRCSLSEGSGITVRLIILEKKKKVTTDTKEHDHLTPP